MTSNTFLSDSGMASYWDSKSVSVRAARYGGGAARSTYQLISTIDMHEPIKQIKDLYPQHSDICGLALDRLKLHERLAEQRRSAQTSFGHPHRVT